MTSLTTTTFHLFTALFIKEREPVSPDMGNIDFSGKLVCSKMSQENGIAVCGPVLHMLNPGQACPCLVKFLIRE